MLNCGQKKDVKEKNATEKPTQNFMTFRLVDNELIEYDIDTLKNFNEITDILDKIDCSKEYALFKLETDKRIFNIQPLQFCDANFDYKLREVLYINTDSITVNYELKFPIDSLKKTLKNHLLNPSNDKNYPSLTDKKLISINVDNNKNMSEVKRLLLRIILDINELETKVNFSFMFENHGIIEVIEE